MPIAAVAPSPYWFITRGTGAIALVLLTISVALGVATARRMHWVGRVQVPRFVIDAVHRSASLLAVTFLIVHIATALLDGFAPIGLLDVVIPLHSAYRPLWLGLGACAFDLLVAVTVTSLVRVRLGHRAWRATHWLAYGAWPLALVHGFGTGTDARTHWMLLLTGGCVVVVLVAVVARATAGWPAHPALRLGALGAAAALPVGLLAWLPSGPLARGWARRAGTPAYLLASAHRTTPAVTGRAGGTPSVTTGAATSFTATVSGTVRQAQLPDGRALIDILLATSSSRLHDLHIRIRGQAVAGGGVSMTTSRASAGPQVNPDEYQGRVTGLAGTSIRVAVADRTGAGFTVTVGLSLQPGSDAASGSMTATPR